MIVYVTPLKKQDLKEYFLNFRSYYVIDTYSIREEELKYDIGCSDIMDMLVEVKIMNELKKARHKRRNMNIIYICESSCSEMVSSLKDFFSDFDTKVMYVHSKEEEYVPDGVFDGDVSI